ncbi:MAG TPA: DUF4404 family protein [Steroidobacteraceae bacterium]|nr:DUF4404 family protein [Steroidobacteraceae bacterium]
MNSPVPPSPPTREQLQGSLRALHAELARTARVDASSHQLLQQLLRDMHRLLQDNETSEVPAPAAAADAVADGDGGRPTQRLERLAVQFEAEHPRLAGSLRQFVELCSRAGL